MTAAAKRKPGVEHDGGCTGVRRFLPARADPQVFAKLHRRERVHPAAFPRLILDFFNLKVLSIYDRGIAAEPDEQLAEVCVLLKKCTHHEAVPQWCAV